MHVLKSSAELLTDRSNHQARTVMILGGSLLVLAICLVAGSMLPRFTRHEWTRLAANGSTAPGLLAIFAGVLAVSQALTLGTAWVLRRRGKPAAEGVMVGRIYMLAAALAILFSAAYGFGAFKAFTSFVAALGGMMLGWALQAPISGFAAWVLVSLKRPFRPGDRIQFPNLGLVGDVKDVGIMYTMLDQVGGTIGSEEAVGRYILVPNAMLFSQVVINYTVSQEAAFMLDEVVVRITYDSNWEKAEKVLLDAAREMTKDIVDATGVQPYIRCDLYDYGVYLRLRYQTRVQERVEIAYRIQKRIFEDIQKTPSVDLAIPYVYSYRAGMDMRAESVRDKEATNVQEIELVRVKASQRPVELQDVEQLAQSIAKQGLLQPIMVARTPEGNLYEIMAGDLRFAACKKLGWKTIPAVIIEAKPVDVPAVAGDAAATG